MKKKNDYFFRGEVAATVALLIFFICFLYDDMVVTYSHSIDFLECFFSGHFLDFYKLSLGRRVSGYAADYYLPIYILFGIWNLPIWAITKILGITLRSFSLMWCKLIIIPFVIGSMIIIKKIIIYMQREEVSFYVFILITSLGFALPVFATGQYDIISLCLILYGMWISIKENKITKKVILFFALALPFKLFAIFPFIIMVLLKEKNIWKIVKNIILCFSGLLFFSLPFIGQPEYYEALSTNEGWIQRLLECQIPGGIGGISIFFVLFFCLCLFAYLVNAEDFRDYVKWTMWLNCTFWVSFFCFVPAHPYWSIFLITFIVLTIAVNEKHASVCLMLNIVINTCMIIVQGCRFWWVYFYDTANLLILKNVTRKMDVFNIEALIDIVEMLDLSGIIQIIYTLFVVASFALLFIAFPNRKLSNIIEINLSTTKKYLVNTHALLLVGYMISIFLIIFVI